MWAYVCILLVFLGPLGCISDDIPQGEMYTIRGDYDAVEYSLPFLEGWDSFGFSYYHVEGPSVILTFTVTLEDGSEAVYQQNSSTSYTDKWFEYEFAEEDTENRAVSGVLRAKMRQPYDIPANQEFEYAVVQLFVDAKSRETAYPPSHYWDKWVDETACSTTHSFPLPDRAGELNVYYVLDAFQDVFTLLACDTYGSLAGTVRPEVAPVGEVIMMNLTVYNSLTAVDPAATGIYFGVVFESDDGELREVAYMAHDERSEECSFTGVLPSLVWEAADANCVDDCDGNDNSGDDYADQGWIIVLGMLDAAGLMILTVVYVRHRKKRKAGRRTERYINVPLVERSY